MWCLLVIEAISIKHNGFCVPSQLTRNATECQESFGVVQPQYELVLKPVDEIRIHRTNAPSGHCTQHAEI